MSVDPHLYEELAKALGQPSKAYLAATEALNIPRKGLEGYLEGTDAADKIQDSRFDHQSLEQALGGQVPESLAGFRGLNVRQMKPTAELLTGVGALDKALRGPAGKEDRIQQGQFQYNGMLTRFNPISGDYDALTPEGWKTIGLPSDLPKPGSNKTSTSGSIPSGGDISPRVPPTIPNEGADFFTRADTLRETLDNVKKTFRPDYVGPIDGRVGAIEDKYISSMADPDRSLFRNRVAKAFNNLVYLRTGKQLNESESDRMAEEFIQKNNTPVAFQTALQSMGEEMNSLVANRRKAYASAGYRGSAGMGNGADSQNQSVGDPEADAAIAKINSNSRISSQQKNAMIQAVRSRMHKK